MDKANWDAFHTKVFCEICMEETQKDNRPLGCLNRKGYKHLEEKFFALTKLKLSKKQFKNKWDMLKKEYTQFMELKIAATGLGWDEERQTIEADDDWWELHLQNYPKHAKWRNLGPPNLKEMDVMFSRAHVTGETATIPGEISSSSDDDAMELKEPNDVEELTPDSSSKKKKKEGKILGKRKMKTIEDGGEKNLFLREFKETCGNINARLTGATNPVPNSDTPLFHSATMIVMKPTYRELFMLIKTKEGRFDWLQREHEKMTK